MHELNFVSFHMLHTFISYVHKYNMILLVYILPKFHRKITITLIISSLLKSAKATYLRYTYMLPSRRQPRRDYTFKRCTSYTHYSTFMHHISHLSMRRMQMSYIYDAQYTLMIFDITSRRQCRRIDESDISLSWLQYIAEYDVNREPLIFKYS